MSMDQTVKQLHAVVQRAGERIGLLGTLVRDGRKIVVFAAVALACFAAAVWDASLLMPTLGVVPVCLFSGVAGGLMLAATATYRPAVLAGAFGALLACNLVLGGRAGAIAALMVGHAVELFLILVLVSRAAQLPYEIKRFRELVVLFTISAIAAGISGIVVALGLEMASFSSASPGQVWWGWVASHVVGIVAVAPAISVLATEVRQRRPMERIDFEGAVGILLLMVLIYGLFLARWELASPIAVANLAVLLPILLWLAMRCPPAYPAAAVLTLAAAIKYDMRTGTMAGSGLAMRKGETFLGALGLMDTPREAARRVVQQLRASGIRRMILLSGDNQMVADAVAKSVGIDEARGNLMPDDKVETINALREQGMVAMVGDGVNDAPAMANATVGIAMGAAGSDVALETADVALMADNLDTLPFAVDLSRATSRIIRQNLWISLGVITLLVPSTVMGLSLGVAVLAHEGSTLVVVINALRLLVFERK